MLQLLILLCWRNWTRRTNFRFWYLESENFAGWI